MTTRDLRDKYGGKGNSTRLINAAIRAEIPGGSAALDALDELRYRRDWADQPAARFALQQLNAIVAAMAADVRQRYGMPGRENDQGPRTKDQ